MFGEKKGCVLNRCGLKWCEWNWESLFSFFGFFVIGFFFGFGGGSSGSGFFSGGYDWVFWNDIEVDVYWDVGV